MMLHHRRLRQRSDGSEMMEHAVVIAGGGPTGLMLAGELALAGVDAAIVERRPNQDLAGMRAGGLHPRTIEVFDQRGIAERFLAQGKLHHAAMGFCHTPLNLSDFPTRHSYYVGLWQQQTERILAGWVEELGVRIYRGCDVTGFVQDDTGCTVTLSDGRPLRAQYLVGCDGGRSAVRKSAGIAFDGWDATKSWLIAEAEFTGEPAWGFREDDSGTSALARSEDGRMMRVVLTEPQLTTGGEPVLHDVSQLLKSVYGSDYGIHDPTSISRFTDMTRQAAAYRDRRVLLAGDAGHVHPPMGGQGLNLGVQDAVNLGWKLAQVVKGISPESLLDTYHAERHPIAARVLRNTMAHVALQRRDARTRALGEIVVELLKLNEARKYLTAEMSGLDIHYAIGDGHPLVGRRVPDLDITTSDGPIRVFSLLHGGWPVLLNLGEPGRFDLGPWADRVRTIDATYVGAWELPVLGVVTGPSALLIRPDGYVCWAGEGMEAGLTGALATWFGTAVAS
jgi:2-polyprenyl-6-methoxyphenol hydroxylase-like FAD-dependent oxidoreductase